MKEGWLISFAAQFYPCLLESRTLLPVSLQTIYVKVVHALSKTLIWRIRFP